MRFLSDEWFAAMGSAVATVEAPEGVALRLGQVVTDTPEGDVAYVIDCGEGRCALTRGSTDGADVLFRSSFTVAQRLADGGVNEAAGHAVLRGDVEISGDVTRLLAAGDLAVRLAQAMATAELQA